MTGVALEVIIADEAVKTSKDYKKANVAGSLPLLVVGEAGIGETIAICKYLAKVGPDASNLLGASIMEQTQVA